MQKNTFSSYEQLCVKRNECDNTLNSASDFSHSSKLTSHIWQVHGYTCFGTRTKSLLCQLIQSSVLQTHCSQAHLRYQLTRHWARQFGKTDLLIRTYPAPFFFFKEILLNVNVKTLAFFGFWLKSSLKSSSYFSS